MNEENKILKLDLSIKEKERLIKYRDLNAFLAQIRKCSVKERSLESHTPRSLVSVVDRMGESLSDSENIRKDDGVDL